MKYILMMNAPKNGWEAMMTWPKEALHQHIQFMKDLNQKLKGRGELVQAEGLMPPNEAKMVRARKDGPPVIDGVFAETKEFLAGWWIVEVPTAERAYAIAAEASTAPGANGEPFCIPIEVRQVASGPPEF